MANARGFHGPSLVNTYVPGKALCIGEPYNIYPGGNVMFSMFKIHNWNSKI